MSEAVPTAMRAAVLEAGSVRVVDDYPVPVPGVDEVLVRVRQTGVCGTDLEIIGGYAGDAGLRISGHEFVGEVCAGDAAWQGQRVVASINYVPGHPHASAEHDPRRLVIGIRGHDGAFAEYLRVPRSNLIEVPDNVSDRLATFAEPLAAALRIGEQLNVSDFGPVAVVGPGRLGMLIAWTLRDAGAEVRVLGRSDASLALAQRWGLATQHASQPCEASHAMVIEASGSPGGVEAALRIVRPRGTVVLKSTWSAARGAPDLSPVVVKELNVVGSRCGPVARAVERLAAGDCPFEDLIDAEMPLSEAPAAFRKAAEPGVRKVLVSPLTRH